MRIKDWSIAEANLKEDEGRLRQGFRDFEGGKGDQQYRDSSSEWKERARVNLRRNKADEVVDQERSRRSK